jgi:endoglucanase
MVAGGPNSGLQDPVAKNYLAGQPPAKCFLDDSGTYSTNEVAIYWNSPLSYVLAALDQQQASRDGTIQVALRAQGIIDDKR